MEIVFKIFLGIMIFILIIFTIHFWVPFRYEGKVDYHQDLLFSGKMTFLLSMYALFLDFKKEKGKDSRLKVSLKLFWFWKKNLSLDKKEKEEKNEKKQKDQADSEASDEEDEDEDLKWEDIKAFLLDLWEHDKARDQGFYYVKKIAKVLLPRKIKGTVHFGFDDPAMTGQMLGFLSCFYPVTKDSLVLEPDFTEAALEGELEFKGYYSIGVLSLLALRMYLIKDIRKLMNKHFWGKK